MNDPILLAGPSAWTDFADLLAARGVRRMFLVCGDSTWTKSGVAPHLDALRGGGIEIRRFADFSPNPDESSAKAAGDICRAFAPDVILGIGGGSAIDVAKGAVEEEWKSESPKVRGLEVPLLAAIPTTAGTGSEATRFAVLYRDGKKLSLDRPELRPAVALLDASLTASLPPHQAAVSGLDAIAQAIEALWAVRSTPESDAFAHEALTLLLPALSPAVHGGAEFARECMLRGAYLAGRAIDITRTTAAHAFSYAFTSAHGIPHGNAVWLTLPSLALHNAAVTDADCTDPRGADFVRGRVAMIARRVAGSEDPAALASFLRRLATDVGVETDPLRLGVADEAELRSLLAQANPERMANNPRSVDPATWLP